MSVETLLSNENRIADMMVERNQAAKPAAAALADAAVATEKKANSVESSKKAEENEPETANTAVSFDNDQIRQTLEQINKVIPITNTRLVFEFDELGDPPVIKVIDKTSNELIREIPSQDLVKVAKAFSEMADNLTKAGGLINFQA